MRSVSLVSFWSDKSQWQHAIFLCVNVQCVLGRVARPWSNDGFSHARTTFVRSFIRIDRSFVFLDSFAQRNRLDSSQPFPRFLPPIVRQFFRLLVLGNLRREPRFRTSKIATYSARCDFVAHSSPQLLVCGERVSVKTTAQLRLLGAVSASSSCDRAARLGSHLHVLRARSQIELLEREADASGR